MVVVHVGRLSIANTEMAQHCSGDSTSADTCPLSQYNETGYAQFAEPRRQAGVPRALLPVDAKTRN